MRKPVVFIPGYPGSDLWVSPSDWKLFPPPFAGLSVAHRRELIARLSGPDDPEVEDGVSSREVITGLRVAGLPIMKEAETLYRTLRAAGYTLGEDLRTVPWDWRLPVDHHETLDLAAFAIRELAQAYGSRVVVMAHSTGGLVLRALLERRSPQEASELAGRIERVLALGVPWAGTLKTLRYIGIGSRALIFSASEMQTVIGHSWAAYDLMPPDPAHTDMTDPDGDLNLFVDEAGRQTSPFAHLTATGPRHVQMRATAADRKSRGRTKQIVVAGSAIPVVNVAGWGAPTDTCFRIQRGGRAMRPDASMKHADQGDGTIPYRSAAWLSGPSVVTFPVPIGLYEGFIPATHSQIWETPPAKEIIQNVLADRPLPALITAAVDHEQVFARRRYVDIRISAFDEEGRPLPATARFAPQAGQRSRPVTLQEGRGTLSYEVGARPSSGRFLCPVIVTWRSSGGEERVVHLQRYFYW